MRSLLLALVLSSIACGTPADPPLDSHAASGGHAALGGSSSGGTGENAGSGGSATGGNAGNAGTSAGTGAGGSPAGGGVSGSSGTGGSGNAGTGGESGGGNQAGATSDYDPCPPEGTPCKVMPLGDSITLGLGGGWTGYRIPVFQYTLDAGQLLTYVGTQIDGPETHNGVPFPQGHEGHSGYVITAGGGRSGLQELIVDSLNTYQPHIVLMMIGTNDVDVHLEDLPTKLGTLMDTITDTDPTALLVAAKIVPTTDDAQNAEIVTYNGAFDDLVATRVAAGKHIITVDMYTAFTSNENYKTEYMNDELHPNNAGYQVMADTWYAAISPLLR